MFRVPGDAPATTLGRLVKRLQLRYTRSFVSSRVARHTEPTSLLALVEVGAELGMKITAARTDASGLAELNLPVVVHMSGPDGEGGFGILERATDEGLQVWDSRSGRRRVDKDVFLAHWSGVVGLVERDDSRRVPETGYLRHRLMEVLAGSGAPPALVGSPAASTLRYALAVLAGSLLVMAVAAHPSDTRPAALALMTATVIGLAVTTTMALATADHTRSVAVPGCPRGRLIDCESVLTSPYSRIAGIPLSEIGVAFFGAILLLIATAAFSPESLSPWSVSGLAYLLAVPFALLLVTVQVFMRQFCTLCLMVHVVIAAAAATSPAFLGELRASDILAAAILLALYASLILFLAIPHFTRIARMNSLVASHQRIASSPYATLAQILTEQPTGVRGAACGVRLDGPPSANEVVLFVHPSCAQCSLAIDEARPLAGSGRAEVFVAIAPREKAPAERSACSALVAAGLALGSETMLNAYRYAKRDFNALLERDPIGQIADGLSVPRDRIESTLERAQRLTHTAEETAEAHIEGTPAVFFNSRLHPYTAPLGHLSYLLEHHTELLKPTRITGTEPVRPPKEVVQT